MRTPEDPPDPDPGPRDGPGAAVHRDPYGLRGTTVAHYAVEEVIGGGGMGVVYRARDTRLHRTVALKFLPPTLTRDPGATERFTAEARAASALDHPNICTVHEIGETDDGHPFIAMAYYPGASLRARLDAGPLPPDEAAAVAAQVARGLARAHAAGIVHRDVKPANVMVTPEGQVKLVDFGVAKVADVLLTQVGTTLGTTAYMSPEQTRGAAVDARADQWALGVVLYEMLAGERPFRGAYDQAVVYAILHEDPPPLTDAPAPLAAVVARCLAKDPAGRFPDTDALADALDEARRGTSPPARAEAPPEAASPQIRRWVAGAVAAAALGAVALLFRPAVEPDVRGAAASGLQQVAVLPFTNVGGDSTNQAFIDGLVYTIGATLTEMEQFSDRLSVLPTDEARETEARSPREVAERLGVDLVVSGSVQRSDARVRLTLEVYDAATDRRLGSRVLDETTPDLLALQDSVAATLASLLDVELNEAARTALAAGGTTSPAAFDLYTQARGTLQDYEAAAAVDRAIGLFERALAEDDRYALAWAGLGEASWRKYEATNDTRWAERAAEAGERAVALDETLAPVRVTLGMIYKGTGRYEDAERELRRALELDDSDALAHQQLGSTLYFLERFEEAVPEYRRAIALKPGYWGFYNNLGNFYLYQGQTEAAIPQYRRVTELRPDNPWGYSNLGDAYYRLGRLDSAAHWYRRAARANPAAAGPTSTAYLGLGKVDFDRRAYDEAARSFRRAVQIDSASTYNWYFLGNALYLAGRPAEARRAWDRVIAAREPQLEVNPEDENVLSDLVHVYAFSGRPERARAYLDRLVARPRRLPYSYLLIARFYEQLGDRASALDFLRDGLEAGLDPAEIERSPWLDELRDDPRYARLLPPAPSS